MPDVWSTFDNTTIKPSNNTRSTSSMHKMLQTNAEPARTASPVNEPTRLILDREFFPYVLKRLEKSNKQILICAYAWQFYPEQPEIPLQKFLQIIDRKGFQGKDVRVICNQKLLYEQLKRQGIRAKFAHETKLMHTKAICIDQERLIIGSHNLTKRACNENYEMSIETREVEPIIQFIDYYERLWAVSREN